MPRPLEDATGLMIQGPLSLAKQSDSEEKTFRQQSQQLWPFKKRSAAPNRGLTAEFLVLIGKHKSLWNDVEVLKSMSLLHSLDVLVETVFACQFVWPGNEQREPRWPASSPVFRPSQLNTLAVQHGHAAVLIFILAGLLLSYLGKWFTFWKSWRLRNM